MVNSGDGLGGDVARNIQVQKAQCISQRRQLHTTNKGGVGGGEEKER